ncbi:MAG: Gfo/Idh/MocA family oxidoreductase, partial [Verrucomicrobiota bacterium]
LPNVEVVAHVDSNPDQLEEKLRFTQARRHYATCRDMLEQETPDIVVICSRHPQDHLPLIEAAAKHGCHLYCEKPLAATLEEADRIVELADRHRIKVAMAHPARYALPFLTMKRLIKAGEIGQPRTIHGLGKCDHRGGGEDLVVLGTHILDLMVDFFGPPMHVSAEITINQKTVARTDRTQTVEPVGPAAGDRIFATFGFENGVRGIFESQKDLLQANAKVPYMGVTVHGTNGVLSLRFDDAKKRPLLIRRENIPAESGSGFEEVPLAETREIAGAKPLEYNLCGQPDIPSAPMFLEANRFAVWDLIKAIKQDRPPLANIHDARVVQEMIYGVYASHFESGARTVFPLLNRTHPLLGEAGN